MPVSHVGIPFGPWHPPPALYGTQFSGGLRVEHPDTLLMHLEAARRASARVIIGLVGGERRYRDEKGFNLETWKKRVDRYRAIDISSYIEDGTIVGHFLMDEPSDRSNWNGTQVSPAQIDEMAKYSKELWPSMPTLIRGWPDYLIGYRYKYLDAAWAQYGGPGKRAQVPIGDFITNNVRDAKAAGLALVMGLNLLGGGSKEKGITGFYPNWNAMSADEIRTWGGLLLAESYICAFMSWKYNATYFSRPDIKAAISDLEQLARNRPKKACRP